MQEVLLDYGDTKMAVSLPKSAQVVRYGETYVDPPETDPHAATQKALESPLGFPPLKELAGGNKKVVIGFPDRVKGGAQKDSHRKVAIPLIVEQLTQGGTPLENISLLCCTGLHRKNTLEEWYWYLGKGIVDQFWPDRLFNHDAEAADLCDFGADEMGNVVQCNRLMAEADLPIVVGHCSGNPYGGYSGGHKMIATGLAGWRSIASHHCPETMHREDWLGASPHSHMRKQFKSIAQAVEKAIGKKFFAVDAVIGQQSQVLGVQAGALEAVEEAIWPLADQRTNVYLDMKRPADVLVIGLPRSFHYGPGMGTNPILMSLAIAGQLSRSWNALRREGVIIAASVCDGWFNDTWFPSYEETYEELQEHTTVADFLSSNEMQKISTDTEYCFKYSNFYAYHPFHAMSMISGGGVPALCCSDVLMVGAKAPRFARGMGYKTVNTFEEALTHAKRIVGNNPNILCTPECFSGGVPVHLHLK